MSMAAFFSVDSRQPFSSRPFNAILKYSLDLKIKWQTADDSVWANACDFPDGDFESAKVEAKDCGLTCFSNPRCTHFAWTDYEGGTCWMKSGVAKKEEAVSNDEQGSVCGILDQGIKFNFPVHGSSVV